MSDASPPDYRVSHPRDSPCLPLCDPVPQYLAKQYLGPPYAPPQNTTPESPAQPPDPSIRRTAAPNIVKLTATALLVLLAAVLMRPLGKLLRLIPRANRATRGATTDR